MMEKTEEIYWDSMGNGLSWYFSGTVFSCSHCLIATLMLEVILSKQIKYSLIE